MARNKTAQGGISLRRKVTAWLAAILLVTMLSTGIATMAGQWTVRSFDMLLADNAVCYTVQNALKDETQAFARYVRQPTSETEQAYTAACTASEQSLAALNTGMIDFSLLIALLLIQFGTNVLVRLVYIIF